MENQSYVLVNQYALYNVFIYAYAYIMQGYVKVRQRLEKLAKQIHSRLYIPVL